jgi:hypothetical protein
VGVFRDSDQSDGKLKHFNYARIKNGAGGRRVDTKINDMTSEHPSSTIKLSDCCKSTDFICEGESSGPSLLCFMKGKSRGAR